MNKWAAALVGVWLGSVAATPTGWVEQAGTGRTQVFNSLVYLGTSVILFPERQFGASATGLLRTLANQMAEHGLCPPLARVTDTPDGGALALSEAVDNHCAFYVTPASGGAVRVTEGIARGPTAMSLTNLAQALLQFRTVPISLQSAQVARPSHAESNAAPTPTGHIVQPIGAILHGHMAMNGLSLNLD